MIWTTDGRQVGLYGTSGATYFGPGGTHPGEPSEDLSTLTLRRQVTNNTAYHRVVTADASTTGGLTTVTEHQVRAPATALQLQWTVRAVSGNVPATGPNVITRAGFSINGTFHPVTFNGSPGARVVPGSMIQSDPTREGVIAHPGETIYSVVEVASGQVGNGTLSMDYPARTLLQGSFDGSIPAMVNGNISGPSAVYGLTTPLGRPVSIVGLGDSFMEQGWYRKAAEGLGMAWTDWSVWLDRTFTTPRLEVMPATGTIPYDVAFVGWGGNDKTEDLAAWQTLTIQSWRLFESTGQKVAGKTLHPYTNSTNNWTTVEGQTHRLAPALEQTRVARNNWLRDGAPIDAQDAPLPTGTTASGVRRAGEPGHPLAFPVFDEADTCETARDSGIWKVTGGPWVADGAHLTSHGSSMMQAAFREWLSVNMAGPTAS